MNLCYFSVELLCYSYLLLFSSLNFSFFSVLSFFQTSQFLYSFSFTFWEMSPNFVWFSLRLMRELIVCFQWKKTIFINDCFFFVFHVLIDWRNKKNSIQEWKYNTIQQTDVFFWMTVVNGSYLDDEVGCHSFLSLFQIIHFHSTVWFIQDSSLIHLVQTMNTIDGWLNVVVVRRS